MSITYCTDASRLDGATTALAIAGCSAAAKRSHLRVDTLAKAAGKRYGALAAREIPGYFRPNNHEKTETIRMLARRYAQRAKFCVEVQSI